jgi:hypothetical protein
MFRISFGVRNLIGCIICSGYFTASLVSVSMSSFYGSSFGLNVFPKCPAKVFAFFFNISGPDLVPASDWWDALCVVSVVLIVWLLSRVNSRCQLSLLGLASMYVMFLL